jgi:formamidopyrimidine-DNA glycosylase
LPELPEVETIARSLRSGGVGGRNDLSIPGRRVKSASVLWNRTIAQPPPVEFVRRLVGQTVGEVGRRGKFLTIHFDRDILLVHLRMSGDLRVEPDETQFNQTHDRVLVSFEDGIRLVFNDTRKFGRMWLTNQPEKVLGNLGLEPFDPALDAEAFHQRISRHRRQLKPLLLDQSFLAGMGNIYTDEALHLACLHPLAIASRLNFEQSSHLLQAIRQVLSEGIQRNGASIDWVYRGGEFQNVFRVYQRTGHACPVCGTSINRMVVGQRGTHYCPVCQSLEQPAAQRQEGTHG